MEYCLRNLLYILNVLCIAAGVRWYYHAVLFLPAVFFLKGNEKLNGEGGLDLHAEEG
jgi:hypothetical protein